MENFWSLLKRGLHGAYVAVEPFYLFRYVDEQVFRYLGAPDDSQCGPAYSTHETRFGRMGASE
jgi:hypothetical protein